MHGTVVKVTLDDGGTLNGLDGVKVVDGNQLGVVDNDQTTTDGGDITEVDVAQLFVVFNGQVTTDGGDQREVQFFNTRFEETS